MRALLTFFILCSGLLYGQEYTVLQINAHWNEKNKIELPGRIEKSKVLYAYLEEQNASLRNSIKSVPVILIYRDDKPFWQRSAGIDLKLNVSVEDIKKAIIEDKKRK